MGTYKYIRDLWKQPKKNLGSLWQQRLIQWRKQPVTVRIHRPTRLDRARSLGYRAKQGILVIRQRVGRGGHKRPHDLGGRRPKHNILWKTLSKNYQQIAEERAAKKYANCEIMNSYEVGQDGRSFWYEIIMVDRDHPAIKKDKDLSRIGKQTGRVFRGKTSAGRKARGLRRKGKGVEKARPSKRANLRKL